MLRNGQEYIEFNNKLLIIIFTFTIKSNKCSGELFGGILNESE